MEIYSQNNEQITITDYFGNYVGRFLDVGAYDGKQLSNTYALSLLGWSGICLEPSPSTFKRLEELHSTNDKILTLPYALALEDGEITLYDSADWYSSTVRPNGGHNTIKVPSITWDTLLTEVGNDFDFLNLDVEWANLSLFLALPFEKLPKLQFICVEHESKQTEMLKHALQYGFKEISQTGENLLLVKY